MGAVAELIWTGSYGTTTIDHICEKAGVKKGSFYYFFDCKASLAEAAIEVEWQTFRPNLDAIFSATCPPLDRLRKYCEFSYTEQLELKAKFGYVLGCPLCTLGTEVSTHEKGLQKKVQDIMAQGLRYLETALRDAQAAGELQISDPGDKARILQAYYHGMMTQARIQNKVEILRDLTQGTFQLLGIKDPRSLPS